MGACGVLLQPDAPRHRTGKRTTSLGVLKEDQSSATFASGISESACLCPKHAIVFLQKMGPKVNEMVRKHHKIREKLKGNN